MSFFGYVERVTTFSSLLRTTECYLAVGVALELDSWFGWLSVMHTYFYHFTL